MTTARLRVDPGDQIHVAVGNSGQVRAEVGAERALHKLMAGEVRAAMARQRITGEGLAEQAGVSRTFISRRLRDLTAFDLDDLEAIALILDMTLEELMLPAIRELDRARSGAAAAVTQGEAAAVVPVTQRRRGPNAEKSSLCSSPAQHDQGLCRAPGTVTDPGHPIAWRPAA